MQNTVCERKQNGEGFFSLPAVTYSRFGNCPANGLVTEQPQYSVIICIFSTWQNAETKLISNGLRFIFTCPLFLAQPITFHMARHTFATTNALAQGIRIEVVSRMLGHTNIKTTQIYAKVTDDMLAKGFDEMADIYSAKYNLAQ
ncbi:tyrosine-type recombinase/integrase [Parabacteroides goldsteinii]|uniref:tyrosine-type recombinase/integrase n=1 Tax=Parabacteroides goldsteinii TaxID=328812 RepID=UPI002593FB1E|nr:tyrosine-type recombinase/integrase [Parabacteroides goldsteinii]